MKPQEWKWGLILGLVNIGWLVVSWLAGWHGGRIGLFQMAIVLGFFVSFAGFVFAFREITLAEPEITFSEGICSGALIAAVSGFFTALGWGLYLGWVNPLMPAHLISEIREYYLNAGIEPDQVDVITAGAEKSFGVTAYMIKGGAGAFVTGILFSAISMGWNKWQRQR